MSRTIPSRPSASLVVASLALVVACAGTGYAAGLGPGTVGTAQLRNNAVTSAKIANGAVTGADVRESSLGRVPQAGNAATVGGVPVSGLLRRTGCQVGTVLGFARVRADGDFPEEYATTGVDTTYNCGGGAVEARRITTGRHYVRFVGNPAAFAFAQVRFDDHGADEAACATVRRVPTGPDEGAFAVTTFDCNTDAVVNADFTLLLP